MSTVSIPSATAMPKTGSKGEAGIALVGVKSDCPKYTDEKSIKDSKTDIAKYVKYNYINIFTKLN